MMPPTEEEEHAAATKAGEPEEDNEANERRTAEADTSTNERRWVRVGRIVCFEEETGEQKRRMIMKRRRKDQEESSGRGQASKRWRAIRARIRGKDGRKTSNQRKATERSTLSEAFRKAKDRRDKGEMSERSRVKCVQEERDDTDGWNKEDHDAFMEEARNDDWEMGDIFLGNVQKRLPYMLHSEIVDHRRWAKRQYGSNSTERKRATEKKEAEEKAKNDEAESETDDGDDVTKRFGVFIAKARKDYARDCRKHSRNEVRLVKKQAKEKWAAAVSASGTVPNTHHQGDECTFDFECANHPWAKIHATHHAWFADLVAYCRVCRSVNSKKGTMQKRMQGKACQAG